MRSLIIEVNGSKFGARVYGRRVEVWSERNHWFSFNLKLNAEKLGKSDAWVIKRAEREITKRILREAADKNARLLDLRRAVAEGPYHLLWQGPGLYRGVPTQDGTLMVLKWVNKEALATRPVRLDEEPIGITVRLPGRQVTSLPLSVWKGKFQ